MLYIIAVLMVLVSYLIGSVSGAILISKSFHGEDIREFGSNNAGTTNMLRVYGKKTAVATLLIDVLKGIIAVVLATIIDNLIKEQTSFSYFETNYLLGNLKYLAGLFAILGHVFPIYFKFKGGKGVATSLGVILMLDWKTGLIVAICAVVIMAISRYVSLGSVIGAVVYPCVTISVMMVQSSFNLARFLTALLIGIIVIIKHRSNIVRLKNGTENKLFAKKE